MLTIAHRGGAGLRVENTLAAFANAIRLSADGAELDVQLSADGEVVVHHDALLNPHYCRMADGSWLPSDQRPRIGQLTYAELEKYDIGTPRPGSPYAARFDQVQPSPAQRIPLLTDVIRLVRDAPDDFLLVIEIKTPILEAASRPWRTLVERTLEVVEEEGFGDRLVLCSFDWGALLHAQVVRPGTRTWFTTQPLSWYGERPASQIELEPGAAYLQKLRALFRTGEAPWFAGFDPRNFSGYAEAVAKAGGEAWFMYCSDYTPGVAEELQTHAIEGAAWSINLRDAAVLRRLDRLGAYAACVDYPTPLSED